MNVPQTAAQIADRQSEAKISYQEFLSLETDAWTEWVDGEIVYLPMASATHQKLLIFLASLLSIYAENKGLGDVYCEPFKMKTGPGLPGRSPDILFVARRNLHRVREKDLDGPADLVVEIVSPDSSSSDRIEKFGEYEQGGVGEYWIIDPQRQQAELFELSQKRYRPLPVREETVHSRVLPGLWLKTSWLWQKTAASQDRNPAPLGSDLNRSEVKEGHERTDVHEYWIIDPLTQKAHFYRRAQNGRFHAISLQDGIFRSHVLPGLWLKVDWLWQEPLPLLMDILKEWELV